MWKKFSFLLWGIFLFSKLMAGQDAGIVIPYRPDPPIAVDGITEEWGTVNSSLQFGRAEQVIPLQDTWRGKSDLSAVARLAWRPEGLFLAVEVTDDQFANSGPGAALYHGDHVELFFDAAPDREKPRDAFGEGQFHIGISPGNLADTRPVGSFGRCDPEVYWFFPNRGNIDGAAAAARKTANGWVLEAFLPWNALGVGQPRPGEEFKLELVVSDSDNAALPKQGKMMALSQTPWQFRKRARLLSARLADSDGIVPARATAEDFAKQVVLPLSRVAPETYIEKEFDFQPDAGTTPALLIRALLESDKNNGDTFAMNVYLNGKMVDGSAMRNKPEEIATIDGSGMIRIYSASSYGFRIAYASSFEEANLTKAQGNRYARFDSKEPRTDFLLDIAPYVRSGENILRIGNLNPAQKSMLRVTVDLCRLQSQKAAAKQLEPATVYFTPQTDFGQLDYQVFPGNRLKIKAGGREFLGETLFSIPGGQWVNGANRFFRHTRQVEAERGVVVISDTFENLTDQPLGIMQRHEFGDGSSSGNFYVNGLRRPANLGGYHQSFNATTFTGGDAGGLGLMPLDDVFRIHGENYLRDGKIGLCDRTLVLGPKASHTARWAVIPAASGDYWDFLNRLRCFLNSNFKLEGPVAGMRFYPPYSEWSIEKFRTMMELKSAAFIMGGMTFRTQYKGKTLPYLFNHGQGIVSGLSALKPVLEKFRKAVPDVKYLQYFHCYIDSGDDSDQRFTADAITDMNGKPLNYGLYYYPLFFPTQENQFGQASARLLDMLLDELNPDGIFWDEFAQSMVTYHYGKPWDGCSGDIDPNTHEVKQLKSAVSLITRDWRLAQVKKILSRGKRVFANGQINCQVFRDLQIPTFAETAQSTFCARMQLYTPIALGDHLSEATETDAYRNMLNALDYGCVYYWYGDQVYPTHKTLTDKMYPITPIRLGPGFIIGQERILTRKSGFFGWGDASDFDIFVYDEKGCLTDKPPVARITRDGQNFAEINLWPDWSAAIVRKPAITEIRQNETGPYSSIK